jgi:uncharacterized protein YegL
MPRTYVAFILDRSGSMAGTKKATIQGLNEQIQQLKEDAKTQDILVSLVTFNGDVFEHLWSVPVDQLTEATDDNYVPLGATAMRDAMGYTIQKLISTTDYNHPENAYLIITITDGNTNRDQHYSASALKELQTSCEATNKWTFTLMGCTQEYLDKIARETGQAHANMAAWSNNSESSVLRAFDNQKSRQKKYFSARGQGVTSTKNYASDFDGQVANYNEPVLPEQINLVAQKIEIQPIPEQVNLVEIANRGPKYINIGAQPYNGSLFSNNQQVVWEKPSGRRVK